MVGKELGLVVQMAIILMATVVEGGSVKVVVGLGTVVVDSVKVVVGLGMEVAD